MKMERIAKQSNRFQSSSLKSTSNARTWKGVFFANTLLSSLFLTSAFQSDHGRTLVTKQASVNPFFTQQRAPPYNILPLDAPADTNIFQRIQECEYKTSALHMSSLGQDPEDAKMNKMVAWFASKLPPPPEDKISLAGDVACLFLYSFLDHFVNKLYDKWMNSPDTIDFLSASAAIETSSAASSEYSSSLVTADLVSSSLPVWFDTSNSAPFGIIPLSSALPLEHHITYAPAIETAGMASVMICSAWLVSGYFTGAFQFKNTLECSPSRAMLVTAKTWVFCSLIMLALAWSSDTLVGYVNALHKSVGITRADAEYIFDSLSVLLIWRFILCSFFGYDDGDADKTA